MISDLAGDEQSNLGIAPLEGSGLLEEIVTEDYSDPIYGDIGLLPLLLKIINTPEFSRLRDIKQLGLNYLVFPQAIHTRFEHSIGTAHLTKCLLDNIKATQGREVHLETQDQINVITAALCHDIGHGPFSHTFDNNFIQVQFPEVSWSHEQGSAQMFEFIVEKYNIEEFEKSDVGMVQDLILGNKSAKSKSLCLEFDDKEWIFDIVNNKLNSLDIDKLDYLQRDTATLSLKKYDFRNSELVMGARVLNGHLGYPVKSDSLIKHLFDVRYRLFKDVYLNATCQSAEFLVSDILSSANAYLNFPSSLSDIPSYGKLTDSIITQISETSLPGLDQCHSLIKRFEKEDFYSLGLKGPVKEQYLEVFKCITADQIASYGRGITAEDVRVCLNHINYGMVHGNPMEKVGFYKEEAAGIQQTASIWEIPEQWQEWELRVYTVQSKLKLEVKAATEKTIESITN